MSRTTWWAPRTPQQAKPTNWSTQGQALADQYNAVVDEYNRLVESANEIYDSITTRSDDAPTS